MRLPTLLMLAGALPIATLVTTDEAASQGRGRKAKLVQGFDSNKDGWLNRQERDEARKELAKIDVQRPTTPSASVTLTPLSPVTLHAVEFRGRGLQ